MSGVVVADAATVVLDSHGSVGCAALQEMMKKHFDDHLYDTEAQDRMQDREYWETY